MVGTVTNRFGSVRPKDLRLWMDFFDEICDEEEYKCLQNDLKVRGAEEVTIGLKRMRALSKLKPHLYANIDAFLTDINSLAHSYMTQVRDPDIFETVKEFKEKCETEAAEIKKCPDCYEAWKNDETNTKSGYFKLVCPKPHLVVLYTVRLLEGQPIWPAKLFHVKDGMATVACFADHEEDIVPIRDCFLYSEKIPRSKNKKYQRKLNLAYKEVKEHIELIEKKFGAGSFVSAQSKIPVSDLEQHLRDMFPAAYAQSSLSSINAIRATSNPSSCSEQALLEGQAASNCSTSSTQDNVNANEDNALGNDEYSDFNGFTNDDSEYLNGYDHSDDAARPNRPIKSENSLQIEDVIGNYFGHDGEQDNESHADNDDDNDSTLNEVQTQVEAKPVNSTENDRNQDKQKRPHVETKGRKNPVLNKKTRVSQADNPSHDEVEIITLDEDDSDEINATTENNEVVFKEYDVVVEQIGNLRNKLLELEKRRKKLRSEVYLKINEKKKPF